MSSIKSFPMVRGDTMLKSEIFEKFGISLVVDTMAIEFLLPRIVIASITKVKKSLEFEIYSRFTSKSQN